MVVGLAFRDIIPWWVAIILPARDAFLWCLVPFLRTRGYSALPVHFLGKAATFNLLYAFPLLLLGDGDGVFALTRAGLRVGVRDLGDRPLLVGRAAVRLAGAQAPGRPGPIERPMSSPAEQQQERISVGLIEYLSRHTLDEDYARSRGTVPVRRSLAAGRPARCW